MRSEPKALPVIRALMIREMVVTNGRAVGGYAWSVLEPVLGIALLTVIFSAISYTPPIGAVYPLFYATGYLPFMFWTSAHMRVMSASRSSKALLEHSSVTVSDVLIARLALASLTSAVVMAIIYVGIWAIWRPEERVNMPLMAQAFLLTGALAFGVGALNAALSSAFQSWEKVWGIASRPLFIISGVFFPFFSMPANVRDMLWWNPLVHVIGMTRQAVYAGYEASYVSPAYVLAFSAVCGLAGVAWLVSSDRVSD